MKYLLAGFFLLSPIFAQARDICPRPDTFKDQIYNCGKNSIAANLATLCSQTILNRSKTTGKQLAEIMSGLQRTKNNGTQKISMKETNDRLALGMKALQEQILEIQNNTEILASYTDSMIDFPNGNDDASSAECFNDSFHSLQKTVSKLDQEIIQSKAALEEAKRLFTINYENDINMEGSENAELASQALAPQTRKANKEKAKVLESTISGLKDEKK